MTDEERSREQATGRVELGPRSLALLRRIVAALEIIAGQHVLDPGKASETDDEISDQ